MRSMWLMLFISVISFDRFFNHTYISCVFQKHGAWLQKNVDVWLHSYQSNYYHLFFDLIWLIFLITPTSCVFYQSIVVQLHKNVNVWLHFSSVNTNQILVDINWYFSWFSMSGQASVNYLSGHLQLILKVNSSRVS